MRISMWVACVAVTLSSIGGGGALAAQEAMPEEALKLKGLTKVGSYYLVDGDAKLPNALRDSRQAKIQLDAYTKKKADLEAALDNARETFDQLGRAYDELEIAMARQKDRNRYNKMVAELNTIVAQRNEAQRYGRDRAVELGKLVSPRNVYIRSVIVVANQMEAASGQYEALAADPIVTGAISAINARPGGAKAKLGPSAQFAQELPITRRERAAVSTGVIKLEPGHSTPTVQVTLNEKVTELMVVDSGASLVSLSSDTAKKLNLNPGENDPTIPIHLADGKVVDCKLMMLKSVRVGGITAEDVECVIMPESVKGSELLGGTFLRLFEFRIDMAAGDLHLAQLSSKKPGLVSIGKRSPAGAATTKPAAASADANLVTVPATRNDSDAVKTGVRVDRGQAFVVEPNADETWGKADGPQKGKRCDYRGYAAKPGWLAMRWKVGSATGPVALGDAVTAPNSGEILLYCADDRPELNVGSIHATVTLKPIDPSVAIVDDGGWTVLFRSSSAANWDTVVRTADAYAVKIDRAPAAMRYLRMTNAKGEYVIIPLTAAELTKRISREKSGWEGTNYQKFGAYHLGVYVKAMNRNRTGAVDITGRPNSGYTGYGFGNLVNVQNAQGYAWAGNVLGKPPVLEIGVTAGELTEQEKKNLLSE